VLITDYKSNVWWESNSCPMGSGRCEAILDLFVTIKVKCGYRKANNCSGSINWIKSNQLCSRRKCIPREV